jgi:putative tricarboxylic transport membrane protein
MSELKEHQVEWINGLILLIFGGLIWLRTASFPTLDEGYPGPSLFPRLVAGGFMLCGALLLILGNWKATTRLNVKPQRSLLLVAAGLALIIIYPYLLEALGFITSLAILCFAFGLLLRVVWWKAAVTATLTSVTIYVLFVIGLGVPL